MKIDISKPAAPEPLPEPPRYRMSATVTLTVPEGEYGLEELVGPLEGFDPPIRHDDYGRIVKELIAEYGVGPSAALLTIQEFFDPMVEATIDIEIIEGDDQR